MHGRIIVNIGNAALYHGLANKADLELAFEKREGDRGRQGE